MKHYINLSKIFSLLSLFFLLLSCENTNENMVLERGENVVPIVSNFKPSNFTTDLENSYIEFTVSLPQGETIDKGIVEIKHEDKTVQLQEISTFPATVRISADDAATALGIPLDEITTESVFYLYVRTEKNGRSTVAATTSHKISVFCAYDTDLTSGSYHLVSSDWGIEGNVTFIADENDPYIVYISGIQIVDGLTTGTNNTVKLTINPDTYAITGGKTLFAENLSEWNLPYTNYSFTVANGFYSPCDGSYTINFTITVDQGSFGTNNFTFTKN
ncbi:hypothetical protein [uncultured Proteiniphilum sp.]|uniref:hypothetical protein n=1 Tax=uncultured Proteiniphilum sp. TaxID=497637 RepID=UPI002601B2F9|nr:hypothetical protein [uncultured Proteiniphilum sp.]